jgi:hypothetical protein
MHQINRYFTIEYVRSNDLIDKILLKNYPYEWYSNTSYEGYIVANTSDNTLTHLFTLENSDSYDFSL